MTPLDTFKLISAFTSVFGAISWITWVHYHRRLWRYAVLPLSLFLHLFIFIIVDVFAVISDPKINALVDEWHNGVLFHAVITLTVAGILMNRLRKAK